MKKIYVSTIMAAVAVAASALTPTKPVAVKNLINSEAVHRTVATVKKAPGSKIVMSRAGDEASAFTSVQDLEGTYDWNYYGLLQNDSGQQSGIIEIKVEDVTTGTVSISGIVSAAIGLKPVSAVVDIEKGTFSIANKQNLGNDAYGDVNYFYLKDVDAEYNLVDGASAATASVGTLSGTSIVFPEDDIWAIGDFDDEALGWWKLTMDNGFVGESGEPEDPNAGWEDYCTGKLQDGWLYPAFGVNPVGNEFEVTIQRSTETSGLYRIYNPYTSPGFQYSSLVSADGMIVFNISDADFVTVTPGFPSGINNGTQGMINCTNVEGYYAAQGYPSDVIKEALGPTDEDPDGITDWSNYADKVVTVYNARIQLAGAGLYTWGANVAPMMVSKIYFDKAPVEYPVAVTGVTLDQTEVTVKVGETVTLVATVEPEDAGDKTVVWTSSDEAVATVNAEGVVTAVSEGTATVTATCGEFSATCTVTVEKADEPAKPVEVILIPTEVEIEVGETAKIEIVIKNPLPDDDNIVWTSSDETVATVNASEVTAISEGTATITATYAGVSATCTVTVISNMPQPEPSITLSETEKTLKVGEAFTLTATVENPLTTDEAVTWTSSNEAVATVDSEGVVTALSEGTVTITASYAEVTATCTVTVVPGDESLLDEIRAAATSGKLFDLQGRRAGAATKGIVIVNKGGKTFKTILK